MQGMQPSKIFLAELIRFVQVWLDFSKIKAIWAKSKFCIPKKHSISFGYDPVYAERNVKHGSCVSQT